MKGGLGVAALALVCCGGLPILLAVGVAAGTAGLIGGVAVLAAVLGVGLAAIFLRGARCRKAIRRSSIRG